MKNVLQMLERTARRTPHKVLFVDEARSLTCEEFVAAAQAVGSAIAAEGIRGRPIAVRMHRGVDCLIAMMGVVYSGNFYTVIDYEMPAARAEKIYETLCPAAILQRSADETPSLPALSYEDCVAHPVDDPRLCRIRGEMTENDPLYALFTSGSTGIPKGAVISHRNVLAYSAWFCSTFAITEETVFASQTPFYFSMSVSDVFAALRTGATLHILPKMMFSFPVKLLEYLELHRVNTLYWVPSALCIVANWKAMDYVRPTHLKKVLFAGEVMPARQLGYWMDKLPDAQFANLFGPTETTDICTYYILRRRFAAGEQIPIGFSCDNCHVFVVGEDGREVRPGEIGELYVRGPFVGMGYYNDPEKTAAAFVQNPLQQAYPEIVYKTGDLVRQNEAGELCYVSRKDHQIKHMGYRIELSEIEAAAGALPTVDAAAALYDKEESQIVLVYQGKRTGDDAFARTMGEALPAYMVPGKYIRVRAMPINGNGKIDRVWLQQNYHTLEGK